MAFVLPKPVQLLENDPVSFEYLYEQSCNDVVYERLSPEVKYELALRLASLHIYIHALSTGLIASNIPPTKINLKSLDQIYGLENFVPLSIYETVKRKELIRLLTHSMKVNQNMFLVSSLHGEQSNSKPYTNPLKMMSAIEAKLFFLQMLSDMPCFGARVFASSATTPESTSDPASATIQAGANKGMRVLNESLLLGPKHGLGYFQNLNSSYPVTVIKLENIGTVHVSHQAHSPFYEVQVYSTDVSDNLFEPNGEGGFVKKYLVEADLSIALDRPDAEEFILLIRAYKALLLKPAIRPNCDTLGLMGESRVQVIWDNTGTDWWNDGGK